MKTAKPFEISKKLVVQAYQLVKAKGGAAGVDEESIGAVSRKVRRAATSVVM